jgi:hypothetical protein
MMRRCLLTLPLFAVLQVTAYSQDSLDIAVVATGITDVISTQRLLTACRSCSELNPVMNTVIRNRVAGVGLNAGITTSVLYMTHRTQSPRVAKWFKIAAIGFRASMTIRNMYLLRTR